jgi:pimeloyl-ACP methyl ester carboxylesterase
MAADFVICVRNSRNGEFGNEPGPTSFLVVPEGSTPAPVQALPRAEWAKQVMQAATYDSKGVPRDKPGHVLVFVHGYNNGPKAIMERHRALQNHMRELNFDYPVVSFDWPSSEQAIAYLEDRSDAKTTALALVTDCISVLSDYQRTGCTAMVHLIGHSTGAYVIREAFDDADDRPAIAAGNWMVSQLMFIAGDISSGSMCRDAASSDAIFRHCIRLTNYSNPYDAVLSISNVKRAGVAPRVGRIGLPGDVPSKCVNVNCGHRWNAIAKGSLLKDAVYSHSWYFDDMVFAQDMVETMRGETDRNYIPTRAMEEDALFLKTADGRYIQVDQSPPDDHIHGHLSESN